MIEKIDIINFKNGKKITREAYLAQEEILEIFIGEKPFSILMRLPKEDIQLAAGFCLSEGIISSIDDILSINYCENNKNKIYVKISPKCEIGLKDIKKGFVSKSSCSLCGKEIIEDICLKVSKINDEFQMKLTDVFKYSNILHEKQKIFPLTGCVHAAALFNSKGNLIAFSEDVGRHNALDKAIGTSFLEEKLKDVKIAMLSSRCSFEMIQKIARARIPIVASVSAPTNLGVNMAKNLNITVIGFVRKEEANVYSAFDRILF